MARSVVVVLFLVLHAMAAWAVPPLKDHYSPYLAMHADDPVRWRLWGEEVLQQARRENKLIFVSSGYFACHWCHVMQQESFRNEAVAALLNRHTIPVKVDRELSPELDSALFDFVERTRGTAGWPLNVFLTPQGHPLVGIVYLAPEEFFRFVEQLEQRWEAEGELLAQLARQAAEPVAQSQPDAHRLDWALLSKAFRYRLGQTIEQQGDFLAGGLGDGAKFPNVPLLEALLRQRDIDGELRAFMVLTLEQMGKQGLHDHLAGGFFRYTVDPSWQQPHFEKMLYDNALLARLFLHASRELDHPAWREVAMDTLDFMLSEMWHKEGAFIASLSAVDEAGDEGGYYLWTREQLQGVLGMERYRLVNLAWTFHSADEWQGRLLPIPSGESIADRTDLPMDEVSEQLRKAKRMLLDARQQRTLPRDEKRLAGWNGLALSALSEVFDADVRYRQAGQVVRDYLHSLWDGERLWRAKGHPGVLDDYVYVAQGLLAWAEVSKDRQSRDLAERLVESARQRFHDQGGWYRGAGEGVRALSPATPLIADGALPSPAALWAALNRKLGRKVPLQETLLSGPDALLASPLLYPSYLEELEQMAQSVRFTPHDE